MTRNLNAKLSAISTSRRRVLRAMSLTPLLPVVMGLSACGAQSAVAASAPPTAAPSKPAKPTAKAALPDGPLAPEINGGPWINTRPIRWESLRGKVVMVEFWTFGCINCQNVLPLMKSLHADYAKRGFTLLSVHSPEFDYEKKLENVQQAVKKAGIQYPVVLDNDFANWLRYRNRYWPARYLVDKRGVVRFNYIGEGGEVPTRQWIETLLAE